MSDGNGSEARVGLAENELFKFFGSESRKALTSLAQRREFADASLIFEEGAPADGLYLLTEGRVQLFKSADGGRTVDLCAVLPGDYFGELGVLYGEKRMTGARAEGAAAAYRIDGLAVIDALGSEPIDSLLRLTRRSLEYLRAVDERFVAETLRKEKVQLIGELAGSIIHDFKNPLAGIRLAGGLIREEHRDEATQRYCDVILRQSDRIMGMVSELLDFSRGTTELHKEPVGVRGFLEDFGALNRDFLNASHVTLEVQADEGSVNIDRARFFRVLQNLVGNAVDALAPKGGKVKVTVRRLADATEFEVRDDGPGIPEPIRAKLFKPFVTYGKSAGTGLGLAIAKGLVEAHRGTISLATESGRGTTVRILLPEGES